MVVGGFAISIPILFPLNIWLNNGMQGIGAYWGNIVSWPLDMDVARICVQKLIRRPFLFEERNRSRKQLPKANKRARDVGCYNLTIAFKKCKTQVYISIAIYIQYIYISTCLRFIAAFFPGHPTHLWTCGHHPEILFFAKKHPRYQCTNFPGFLPHAPRRLRWKRRWHPTWNSNCYTNCTDFVLHVSHAHDLRTGAFWGGRDWCADL